jgi:hypothetical protein
MKSKSPYLSEPNRLADVISAIQAMGVYRYYKKDFKQWADRISGDESKAEHWRRVFEEHPEFFRLDSKKEKASLVWRRQYPKRYNVHMETTITRDEFWNLPEEQKENISRIPLEANRIETLINAAINLHSRALQQKQDKRWLVTLLIGAVVGLAAAIIGGVLKSV